MRRLAVTALVTSALLLGTNAYASGGKPVSGPSPFPPACSEAGPGTLYPNAEVQSHVAVNPRNPRHLVGTYQQDRWSSIAAQGVLTATSFDGGRTWRRSTPPTSECSAGPSFKRATDSWVSVGPDGTAYLATLAMTKAFFEPDSTHAIQISRSRDGGRTWADPVALVTDGGLTVFNDLPAVTADPSDPRFVYAVWTRIELLNETDFTGTPHFARSTDGGRTWSAGSPLYSPGVNEHTIANKIVTLPNGTLVNVFTRFTLSGLDIRTMTSTDRGQTWSAPTQVAPLTHSGTKDPDTGTPIRDGSDFTQAAVDGRGRLYVAWQDSRFTDGTHDGIVLSHSTDGGHTWSEPTPVNGDLEAPAFSPALAARSDGTVGVTFYDLRNNTPDPATLPTGYWLATSKDAGTTWTERQLTSFDLATAPKVDRPVPSLYLGDYHGLVASGREFVPFFPTSNPDENNRTDIHAFRTNG